MINDTIEDPQVKPSSTKKRSGFLKSAPISIGVKITAPYFFLAIILAVAAGVLVSQIVFDSIEERFANQLVESGKLASERMVIEQSRLLATLRLLSNTVGMDAALQNGDAEALRDLSFGNIVNNQEEAVEFLGATGNHLLSIHHINGGNIEQYDFSSNSQTTLDWEIVQKVLNQNSDPLGDKFSALIQADWGEYFYVAGPVMDADQRLVGVILVGKRVQTLARMLREETLAQISLYDFSGSVRTSTFIKPMDLPADVAQQVLNAQDSSSFRRDLSRELSVQNIGYEEILGAWEGRGNTDLGVMGVSLGKSFLVKASQKTRVQATLLIILGLVIVILVGINLASLITRPINELVHASQRVAGGDLKVQMTPSTQDEISTLMTTFNQMVVNLNNSQSDLIEAYDSTLKGWSNALGLKDKVTEDHTERVTLLTMQVARQLGIPEENMEYIRRGAILHDIGKMGIPDTILMKPGPLTDEEMNIIKNHPVYAYEMLKHIEFLQPAMAIPYCHHEHWDGNGYPRGLKGDEIPLEARIFALADAWDALSSDRPYRHALQQDDVIKIIRSETGTHFDPKVTEIFLKIVTQTKDDRTV